MKSLGTAVLSLLLLVPLFGEVKKPSKAQPEPYRFTMVKEVPRSSVKNQARTGTCWDFATLSFLEAELMRAGKGELDLSEMFVVRRVYPAKAELYVRRHGDSPFGPGGQAHDVINTIKRYGIVPEEVYDGLKIGEKRHNHGELEAVLQGMLQGIVKRPGGKVTPLWKEAFEKVLDIYLGAEPKEFAYQGKSYTPESFLKERVPLNLDDYIEITSYSLAPFYSKVRLEFPDNWAGGEYYNLPIDELERVMDYALENGYTFAWDGDVSERDFAARNQGYAVVPKVDWEDKSQAEREAPVTEPVVEKEITQEMRQVTFDNQTTTDDHLMHITGLAKDQKGAKFYQTKNSWGVDGKYKGYLYMSAPYVRLKTIAIMINKSALPSDIAKKLSF